MKAYLLRILAVSLLSTVFEFLLPHGNVRRFVTPLLSLMVTASVFLPAVSLFAPDGENLAALFPDAEEVVSSAAYETAVSEEYARRIEAEIKKRGAEGAEVFLFENFRIKQIILTKPVSIPAMAYIETELEVPRSLVEIR